MNLRDYERESIRTFLQSAADEGYLSGSVLDYGCGKRPYRDIVETAGGKYRGYDRTHFPGSVVREAVGDELGAEHFDSILCTQVLQYTTWPQDVLRSLSSRCATLVLTYPTCWPEVEEADRWRFTKTGMEALLGSAGFTIIRHERRGVLHDPSFASGRQKRIMATGEDFAIGYGVICRA